MVGGGSFGWEPGEWTDDTSIWQHTTSAWLMDMAMLGVLATLFAGVTRWRLRR